MNDLQCSCKRYSNWQRSKAIANALFFDSKASDEQVKTKTRQRSIKLQCNLPIVQMSDLEDQCCNFKLSVKKNSEIKVLQCDL